METNIIFEFKILNLQTIPELRGFKNVIKRVNLLVTASHFSPINNTNHSFNHIELIGLADPDNEYSIIKDVNDSDFFIPFEQITQDKIIEWLNITNPIIGDIKKELAAKLKNFVDMYEPQDTALPWLN